MISRERIALNQSAAPNLTFEEFCRLARELDVPRIEVRNDIPNNLFQLGVPAETVKAIVSDFGIEVVSVNALLDFDLWDDSKSSELCRLSDFAADIGAEGVLMVPSFSVRYPEIQQNERRSSLVRVLSEMEPIFKERGILGFVEPLGFEDCFLRFKADAIYAIDEVNDRGSLTLVHDTFHHFIASDSFVDGARTGLAHFSGLTADKPVSELVDADRCHFDRADRIRNIEQIAALERTGFTGAYSFEPFCSALQNSRDPAESLGRSIDYICSLEIDKAEA